MQSTEPLGVVVDHGIKYSADVKRRHDRVASFHGEMSTLFEGYHVILVKNSKHHRITGKCPTMVCQGPVMIEDRCYWLYVFNSGNLTTNLRKENHKLIYGEEQVSILIEQAEGIKRLLKSTKLLKSTYTISFAQKESYQDSTQAIIDHWKTTTNSRGLLLNYRNAANAKLGKLRRVQKQKGRLVVSEQGKYVEPLR